MINVCALAIPLFCISIPVAFKAGADLQNNFLMGQVAQPSDSWVVGALFCMCSAGKTDTCNDAYYAYNGSEVLHNITLNFCAPLL